MNTEVLVRRFTASSLRSQIVAVLTAWGMPADKAATTADVMVDTDLSGIDSHGVSMLMMYEKLLHAGRLDLCAEPEILSEGTAFAVIDGHNNLGHSTAVSAVELAIDKARNAGVGMVAVCGSYHFGALGYYARIASSQGLVALITTTTRTPTTSATGGTTPILGTNPICFSAPRTAGEPLVVDISTSVVALNKVKAYALKGLPLPQGWVTDRHGADVLDAATAYALLTEGAATLSPLGGPTTDGGGHKGYGLALMVQVLSAGLSGAAGAGPRGAHDNLGHFFLIIDPAVIGTGSGTADHVEQLLRAVQAGEPEVLIPGDPEQIARADRGAAGIPMPPALVDHLTGICDRSGVEFMLQSAD